jgi:hypothetical protein
VNLHLSKDLTVKRRPKIFVPANGRRRDRARTRICGNFLSFPETFRRNMPLSMPMKA